MRRTDVAILAALETMLTGDGPEAPGNVLGQVEVNG